MRLEAQIFASVSALFCALACDEQCALVAEAGLASQCLGANVDFCIACFPNTSQKVVKNGRKANIQTVRQRLQQGATLEVSPTALVT